MSTYEATKKSDVYQIITDKMISLLEAGTIPWQKPWKTTKGGKQILPKNFISNKNYNGINLFLLSCTPYESNLWLTYNQAKGKGGSVKKGEKGFPVVFWNFLDKKDRASGQIVVGPNGKVERIPLLRYYTVFNIEQCEGIEIPKSKTPLEEEQKIVFCPNEEAEKIWQGMPGKPELLFGGNAAYYSPSLDIVKMPEKESFVSPAHYYSVLFHEVTHSTGHKSRLARKGFGEDERLPTFGSSDYSKEELIAEMGACFLCGFAGIVNETQVDSASYLASWIAKLKGDSRLIVTAAAQAQKAANYVLNGANIPKEEGLDDSENIEEKAA